MISLHFLIILLYLVGLDEAYPSSGSYYGTRHVYGDALRRSPVQWAPYRPALRTQRSPLNYYTGYPYTQTYLDDYYRYYPQETYPIYYPRTSKYDLYQGTLPSFYKKPMSEINDGYYYDIDPAEFQEEMLQEAEREEREEAQPIGHEMLYENEDYVNNLNNYDKASIAYFQKLLAQKNEENLRKQKESQLYNDYNEDYENDWQDIPATKLPPSHRQKEDKEVQDLRKLKNKSGKTKQKPNNYNQDNYYLNTNYKRSDDEQDISNLITSSIAKTQLKPVASVEIKPSILSSTTMQPAPLEMRKDVLGQKEEVMMRPATPVRHPFNEAMLKMVVNNEQRKRSTSVFDTLKRMLEMEKSLNNKYHNDALRPVMRKRIIADEDSLTHQLSVLKKSL